MHRLTERSEGHAQGGAGATNVIGERPRAEGQRQDTWEGEKQRKRLGTAVQTKRFNTERRLWIRQAAEKATDQRAESDRALHTLRQGSRGGRGNRTAEIRHGAQDTHKRANARWEADGNAGKGNAGGITRAAGQGARVAPESACESKTCQRIGTEITDVKGREPLVCP